jgi:Carboxypeptidase regulatory-like domain
MSYFFRKLVFTSIFLSLLSVTFIAEISAQDLDDVSVSGKVSDSNGLPIAGANVTATLLEKSIERTVTTNTEGRFRLIELAPGLYKIKVSADGFGAKERIDLQTISGQNLQLDFTLAPADIQAQQTVTVTEEDAPAVDTTRIIVGGTVTQREIEELPINSRNPLDLILTLGGTSEEALSTKDLAEDRNSSPRTAPAEQGSFSLSGGASFSNNITIDGLDNNDDRSANERFQPSLESIAEVQVITNQFSAEYGRASGGRINLRTKSGGNNFRGRAFMFFRDDNLNANSWYNNNKKYTPIFPLLPPYTNPLFNRLPLTEYNPGFTFSGPLIVPFGEGKPIYNGKNRTFFSIGYEYNYLNDTTLIDTFVPVASNPRFSLPTSNGGNRQCETNATTNVGTPPAAVSNCLLATPTAAFIAPYIIPLITPSVNHIFTTRIDHKLFGNNDLTFGWQFGRKNNRRTIGSSTTRLDDALQARNSNTDALNLTDNHVFGANTVNQFRVQWSRFKPSYQTENPNDPVVLIGYRNPNNNFGAATLIAGNSTASVTGNAGFFAQNRTETRWQFQDSITYIIGSHTLKGGFDVNRVNSVANNLGDATGTFNFPTVLDYQRNTLSRFRQNFGTNSDVTNTYWSLFLNDEFKIRSDITMSYGIRYERETALEDSDNFGPRIGLAFSPWKDGKGVIRFGGGIFYNRVLLRTVGDYIQNDSGNLFIFDTNTIGTSGSDTRRIAILGAIAQKFPNGFASAADLRNVVASTGNAGLGFTFSNLIRSVDSNLKIPESYQFNVGFEREIAKGFVFEANYTFNKTAHLWREYNPNLPVLPSGFADWTAYLTANPFTFTNSNGTVRTYRFYLGSTADGSGVATAQNGTTSCPTTAATTCYVNLNTVSSSTTSPSTAVSGSTLNSVGGPIGIALAAISHLRPDPTVEQKERVSSLGNSLYQGLVLEFRSRYRKLGYGFASTFRAAYTLSSFKDDGLNNTSNAEINDDFSREFTRNLQDRRHRFALSGVFETPNWMGRLKFSPLYRFGSSAPFNLGIGSDRNLNDQSTDRLNFSGNLKDIVWRKPGSVFPDALASQFSLQPIGAKGGNLPRNAGTGPSFFTFDLSVTREFKFSERMKLRPVVQFDNVFNAAVFSYGADFIDFTRLSSTATATQTANFQNSFLVPTRTYRQRQIRLGVRFDF